jgi:drug/metabolite transporter (DMT)-like permease
LAVLGIVMLSFSNAVLAWSEQWVPTGLAALIVAVTPIWFLILETFVFPSKYKASPRALAGLGLGIVGMFVLLWPQLRHTGGLGRLQLLGSISLLFSSLSWAFGSVLAKRWSVNADPFVASGWEMTFAGLTNLLLSTGFGGWAHATWSWRSVGGVVYLVIFGSWVGFSAYVWLLKHVPTAKIATYAYVNPVVAVFLGWLVLHEKITGYIMAGSVVIIAAVALVSGAKLVSREGVEEPELPAVEASAD